MIQQSAVHVTGQGLKLGQILQAALHAQIAGVVDHGFDP